jgi:hypothetical protein
MSAAGALVRAREVRARLTFRRMFAHGRNGISPPVSQTTHPQNIRLNPRKHVSPFAQHLAVRLREEDSVISEWPVRFRPDTAVADQCPEGAWLGACLPGRVAGLTAVVPRAKVGRCRFLKRLQ